MHFVLWNEVYYNNIQQPILFVRQNKIWLRCSSAKIIEDAAKDIQTIIRGSHPILICPLVKHGSPCLEDCRSDRIPITHQCRFYERTLDSYSKQAEKDKQEVSEQLDFEPLSPEQNKFRGIIIAAAKSNISFNSLCSRHFRELLELCISDDSISDQRNTISFNYRRIAKEIYTIGGQLKRKTIAKIRGKTITIMLDGGRVAKNHITAITLLVHDSSDGPLFWDLGPSCSSADDYYALATHYITELDQFNVHVFAFCTDGLLPQKQALNRPELCSSAVLPIMHPIWLYCGNHLTNLVVHDATTKNQPLSKLRQAATNFSNIAREPNNVSLLGGVCPGFIVTRWLALGNITNFIRRRQSQILQSKLLTKMQLCQLLEFEILLYPLNNLHKSLEDNHTRLSDVFLLLRTTIRDYICIANDPALMTSLHLVRVILSFVYSRFLKGYQGDLYALAYCYTPGGIKQYRKHHLSWTIPNYNATPHHTDTPVQESQQPSSPSQRGGVFSYDELSYSFSCLQGKAETTPDVTVSFLEESNVFIPSSGLSLLLKQMHEMKTNLQEEQDIPNPGKTTEVKERVPFLGDSPSDGEQDVLGILDATLASANDVYIPPVSTSPSSQTPTLSSSSSSSSSSSRPLPPFVLPSDVEVSTSSSSAHSSSSSGTTSSSSSSSSSNSTVSSIHHPYNLRPGKTVIIIEEDDDDTNNEQDCSVESETVIPSLSDSVLSSQSSPESYPQIQINPPPVSEKEQTVYTRMIDMENTILAFPPYVSAEGERQLISDIYSLCTNFWNVRIEHAFAYSMEIIFPTATEDTRRKLHSCFLSFIAPSSQYEDISDPLAFHYHSGRKDNASRLFNFQAWCLLSAGCSEASCERIFSIIKWIIGDRRGKLKLETITHILHIICS